MTIFLITAPSGAGKTTLAQELEKQKYWNECISVTSRPMREDEVDGETYYYVTKTEFEEMIDAKVFAETVIYDRNYYGITNEEIQSKRRRYNHVFIIVDHNGYKQVKELYPDAVGIFLHMSKEDCMANMLLRGDSIENAIKRINKYDVEMENRNHYDYVIKNVRNRQVSTVALLKNLIAQY